MPKRARRKPARPIGNRRDYEGASAAARRLSGDEQRDSKAEARLQALLRELDKYDEAQEDATDDAPDADYDSSGPRRRWSDDAAGDE